MTDQTITVHIYCLQYNNPEYEIVGRRGDEWMGSTTLSSDAKGYYSSHEYAVECAKERAANYAGWNNTGYTPAIIDHCGKTPLQWEAMELCRRLVARKWQTAWYQDAESQAKKARIERLIGQAAHRWHRRDWYNR